MPFWISLKPKPSEESLPLCRKAWKWKHFYLKNSSNKHLNKYFINRQSSYPLLPEKVSERMNDFLMEATCWQNLKYAEIK